MEIGKVLEFRRGDNFIDYGVFWFSIFRYCFRSLDYFSKFRDFSCIVVLINGVEVFFVVVYYYLEIWL